MGKIQTREEYAHKIEVHVASICMKNVDVPKVLIAKRLSSRELFPSLWECGGGQIHLGENFEDALYRQVKEEFSINVTIQDMLSTYEIVKNEFKIPGIKFLCSLEPADQEIILSPKEHSEYKWATLNELQDYNLIPGLKEDISEGEVIFKKHLINT